MRQRHGFRQRKLWLARLVLRLDVWMDDQRAGQARRCLMPAVSRIARDQFSPS
ncbi:MAG: hypothetical protein ACK4NW_11820 [Roseinatronobacter sp.]